MIILQQYCEIASMEDLRSLALEFALQGSYAELEIVTKRIKELTAVDKVEVNNAIASEGRSRVQEADKETQGTPSSSRSRKRIGKDD